MMNVIQNQHMDEERALYHLENAHVDSCSFEGEADGESALKESRNVMVTNCLFRLRYPLWHSINFQLENCTMEETARAALWYAEHGNIEDCKLNGVKLLRECGDIHIKNSSLTTSEFGWRCHDISMQNCQLSSDYCLFESRNMQISNLNMCGKYSFQYTVKLEINFSVLKTKDAFWHARNVVVRDSVIEGEYLGWYSDGLTLINCRIKGTQPFCYCKNLTLIHCTMEDTDLAFEYSDVQADISGEVLSVKNPLSGKIVADSYGEIILDHAVYSCHCKILKREK